MDIKQLVPVTVDIEQTSRQFPFDHLPTKEKSADYCYAFCGNLQAVQMRHWKKAKENNGFTNLNSKYLYKIHHEYKMYMAYLVQAGILETDGRFIEGLKCTGYRFAEPHRGQRLKEVEVKEYRLGKSLRRWKEEILAQHRNELRGYQHVVKWLDAHILQIDGAGAREWLQKYYSYESEACIRMEVVVRRIEDNDYDERNYKLGKNSKRLYTVLTGMKSELRNFIRINGETVVCIDLKNCQPYLLQLLFCPEFWQSQKVKTDRLQLFNVSSDLYKLIDRAGILNCITLVKTSESVDKQGFTLNDFKSMVNGGTIYEFLWAELPKMASKEYLAKYGDGLFSDRAKIKTTMLWIMNCDSNIPGKLYSLYYEPYRNFKKLFPGVVVLLEKIKEGNYKRFAGIMQQVESYLMLKITCKRITNSAPNLPLYTIHDSIATTEGNEDIVRKTLEDVFKKYVGEVPQLDVKQWLPAAAYRS